MVKIIGVYSRIIGWFLEIIDTKLQLFLALKSRNYFDTSLKQCKHKNGQKSIYSNRTVTYSNRTVTYFIKRVIYSYRTVLYFKRTIFYFNRTATYSENSQPRIYIVCLSLFKKLYNDFIILLCVFLYYCVLLVCMYTVCMQGFTENQCLHWVNPLLKYYNYNYIAKIGLTCKNLLLYSIIMFKYMSIIWRIILWA